MKKNKFLSGTLVVFLLALSSFGKVEDKLVSTATKIKFFSTTPVENIEATNVKSTSTIDKSTGEVVFSVPMQGFEFEKALMQKHFNSPDFLDTKKNPKAKLVGTIANIAEVDFSKNGEYEVKISGELTINGISKSINESATLSVNSGKVSLASKFNVTLADYGISFSKGKPSTNIAKTVEVTVNAEY